MFFSFDLRLVANHFQYLKNVRNDNIKINKREWIDIKISTIRLKIYLEKKNESRQNNGVHVYG